MRNERCPSDAAESRRQTSGPSPGRNLVIDHLDEFTSALAYTCSTVADYVILTADQPAEMADR